MRPDPLMLIAALQSKPGSASVRGASTIDVPWLNGLYGDMACTVPTHEVVMPLPGGAQRAGAEVAFIAFIERRCIADIRLAPGQARFVSRRCGANSRRALADVQRLVERLEGP